MATDTVNIPSFNASIYSELDELAELEADWDQQGGYAIDSTIIASASDLLHSLDGTVPAPHLAPTSNGSIVLEWSRDNRKKRLKFTFETATKLRFLKWEPRYNIQETGSFAIGDLDVINDLLHWFVTESVSL